MTLDEKIKSLLDAGRLTIELAVGAETDGLWIAVTLGDGQRFGGRSFSEAVDLAVSLRQRPEQRGAAPS